MVISSFTRLICSTLPSKIRGRRYGLFIKRSTSMIVEVEVNIDAKAFLSLISKVKHGFLLETTKEVIPIQINLVLFIIRILYLV